MRIYIDYNENLHLLSKTIQQNYVHWERRLYAAVFVFVKVKSQSMRLNVLATIATGFSICKSN